MGWYGDPDALDASSRGLGADAEGVRGRARALERSVASMRWQGAAATAFRRAVESDADALHRAARELDEAAAALRAHAAEVRDRVERLAAIERTVTGWVDVGDHLSEIGLRW